MKCRVKSTPLAIVLLGLGLALASGCGRNIGDECRTSADCDPNGTRACDLSQPGGYCTVVGCDESSCPEDSACLRYFPEQYISDVPDCDPKCEDVCTVTRTKMVGTEMVEVTEIPNDCSVDEVCLDTRKCARRSFEQRSCAKTCSGNDDCRGGYECRRSNSSSSMLLSSTPMATTGFCAPKAE
jgi:hypothetical protein